MSDTPRTDKIEERSTYWDAAKALDLMADHTRTLERELTAERAAREKAEQKASDLVFRFGWMQDALNTDLVCVECGSPVPCEDKLKCLFDHRAEIWKDNKRLRKELADEQVAMEKAEAKVARLREALGEIAWSNDSQWQSDCARAALKDTDG